jgi:micrococcal nuclease
MKKYLVILLVFILGCGQVVYEKTSDYSKEGPYLVTNVVDGDTLDLEDLGRIRFSGINTPEKGECYYSEAKDALKELTLDKYVYLEKDYSLNGKYGRMLRYVYVDGILVNEVLVREGFARVNDKYREDTRMYGYLKDLEEMAIKDKKGVWSC